MPRLLPVVIALLLLSTACADDPPTAVGTKGSETSTTTTTWAEDDGPPPVTVRVGERSAVLDPWTYCYGGVCADGMPPADLFDVGSPDEVTVEFPLSGWAFTATFAAVGEECPRNQSVDLTAAGDGTFTLRPAGRAGTYDVTLGGRGGGDLYVTFRWTTPTAGELPEPAARLAVLADHDGRVDSYGVELELSQLATTPQDASARITVRAEDGRAVAIDATLVERCTAEGTVYWDGPDDQGLAAAALGAGPFTYEVEVVLDGARHVATARWPDDMIEGNEPSVALEFTPPLPAMGP